jgi:hypothetical protein
MDSHRVTANSTCSLTALLHTNSLIMGAKRVNGEAKSYRYEVETKDVVESVPRSSPDNFLPYQLVQPPHNNAMIIIGSGNPSNQAANA